MKTREALLRVCDRLDDSEPISSEMRRLIAVLVEFAESASGTDLYLLNEALKPYASEFLRSA